MSGRNVHIGGNAVGNVIQTGDHNTAALRYKKVQLPPPEKVDIRGELEALKQLLGQLKTDDQQKIVNAVSEAAGDAAKPNSDKDEVGKAL
jgi:putative heme degradation protein